jgi:hypothetical protein
LVAGWLVSTAGPSEATEEAWRFLEGLRERDYYDMALQYLGQLQGNPLCPDDLKEVIDYEAGVTLMAASRTAGSLREKQLDEALVRFKKFIQEQAEHSLVATANNQLANVLIQRGRIKSKLASSPSKSASQKKALTTEARTLFQEAQKVFEAAEERIYGQAKELAEAAKDDPKATEERDRARADFLLIRVNLVDVLYEIGKTYDPKDKEYKDTVQKAAEGYAELYEKYGRYTAGYIARMREGRAYKDLGEADKAIEALEEVMAALEGQDETSRRLKNESLAILLETFALPSVQKYAEAAAAAKEWQDSAVGAEESSYDGLKIHFLAGKAALAHGEAIEDDDAKRRVTLKLARQHFEFVARFPGEFQQDARKFLMGETLGGTAQASKDPIDYVDAKDRGEFAWTTMVLAMGRLEQAADDERAMIQAEIDQARDEALKCYHFALGFKSDATPTDEVNLIRHRLAHLYWLAKDFYRAAVVGEFLARRYPESAGARQGAEIAVKAYRMLYKQSSQPKEARNFETTRMASVAEYITTRWPNEPVAGQAWMMLLDTAVDRRDFEKAQEYLSKIPPDSPARAEAELGTGQVLWSTYGQELEKPEEERLPQEELDEIASNARAALEQGVPRMRKQVEEGRPVDYSTVYSVFLLAEVYLHAGQAEEAVKWLDDEKIGPVPLVAAKNPVTAQGSFPLETYKLALTAYVGAQRLDKVKEAMEALEALLAEGGDETAEKKLTEIYIRLGQQLQATLKKLREENRADEAEKVVGSFEVFLARISERANTFPSLNWVADTFFRLALALDPDGQETPAEARKHYESAAATYVKILAARKQNPDWAPASEEENSQIRLAMCLRALDQEDQYPNAMKLLADVIRKRLENKELPRVDVQIEAARTYQDWAKLEGKAGYYEFAIRGGQKDENGRNLVWGWGRIAKMVHPLLSKGGKYVEIFHEARYNMALCRLKLAQSQKGTERTATLKEAKTDVIRVYNSFPTMGGPEWFEKHDTLLKTIQRLLGEAPSGLKGL